MLEKKQKVSPGKKGGRIASNLVGLVVMFAVMASLAMVSKGSLFGHKLVSPEDSEVVTEGAGPQVIVNTASLAEDVSGYGGPVPVKVYLTEGRVDSVVPLPNSETPSFFNRAIGSGLLESWNGLPVKEALEKNVDAVSGATYSSSAIIANVRAGLEYAAGNDVSGNPAPGISVAQIFAMIVLLCGAVIPLFLKNRSYRVVQQLANVGVLGFWTGTFLDYSDMLMIFSAGMSVSWASLALLIMLVIGFIMPLFGKQNHYCNWVCPYGSLQELAGLIPVKKLKLSSKAVKYLGQFRNLLWVVLLVLLYAGMFTEWIDYEIFTGFIVKSAAWSVMGVGIAFILLSIFVPRPFCRFVCPMGTLFHKSQSLREL